MKNSLKPFSQILLGVFSGGAFLAIGFLLAVLLHPQRLLTESVLRAAAGFASEAGVDITWTSVQPRAQSVAWLTKKVDLDFVGLCIREKKKGGYNICFDRTRVVAEADFSKLIPRFSVIGPVTATGGRVLIDLVKLEGAPGEQGHEKKKVFHITELIPELFRGAKIRSLQVEVGKWRIVNREKRISGNLVLSQAELNARDHAPGSQIRLKAKGQAEIKVGPFWRRESYRVSADLTNPESIWAWNRWTVRSSADAKLADQRTIEVNLKADPQFLGRARGGDSFALNFQLSGNTMKSGSLIVAKLAGQATPDRIDASFTGSARNTIPEIRDMRVDTCKLVLQRLKPSSEESRYTVDCSVAGTIPVPSARLSFLGIPTDAGLRIQANLGSSEFLPSDTSRLEGNIDVVLEPILALLFEGRGEIHSKIAGEVGEFPRQGNLNATVAVELKAPKFENIVEKLSGSDWAVPAPLQALRGGVTFRAGGELDFSKGMFPLAFRSRLQSPSQSFDLDASGTLEIEDLLKSHPSPQLKAGITLSNLKILLPRLDIGPPPRVVPDPRIRSFKTSEQAGTQAGLGYLIAIKTPPGKPAQLVTNLAKEPVPVNLDLILSDDAPPSGTIKISRFPVEVFKRKATIQHMDFNLAPEIGDSQVDGLVDVILGDYNTHIHLTGTVDKPIVKVDSDPPVPEDQLLSGLLFNRTPEDLDPSESATLGSTRATISSGALNLASLFFLSSTPIQSLSYNPDTGMVTAQIRISQGLSLNLGGGKQQESVGIRKRIGSNFFFTTDLSNLNQSQGAVSAFLEWRKRY